jgi:hypothetical protein
MFLVGPPFSSLHPRRDAAAALGRLAALGLLIAALLGACMIDEDPNAPLVSNATAETVRLVVIANGLPTPISTIESGVTVTLGGFENHCTSDVLVAQSLSGNEIDRRTESLCPNETWTIGD